jgi:RNA polymerase sigma-70 factor (ECF subfamily)
MRIARPRPQQCLPQSDGILISNWFEEIGAFTIQAWDAQAQGWVLEAETRYQREPRDELTPDRLFDRQWALALLEIVLNRLGEEHDTPEKRRLFEALRGTLTGDQPEAGYAAVARQLGVNEGAVKVAVHRLRKRYRELLRAEIAQTVSDPGQVADELRSLFAAVQG